jgi:hypothetical protein
VANGFQLVISLSSIGEDTANKSLKQDKKQLAFAPSSLSLANNFLPLSEALDFFHQIHHR